MSSHSIKEYLRLSGLFEARVDNGSCYACDKKLGSKPPHEVYTADGQMQWVGSECHQKIRKAKESGWQPSKGGPKLFHKKPLKEDLGGAPTNSVGGGAVAGLGVGDAQDKEPGVYPKKKKKFPVLLKFSRFAKL